MSSSEQLLEKRRDGLKYVKNSKNTLTVREENILLIKDW